jgi:hypothetical protein
MSLLSFFPVVPPREDDDGTLAVTTGRMNEAPFGAVHALKYPRV